MTNNFEQENVKSVIPAYEPESTISNTWMPGRARHDKRRSFTPIEPFDKLRASSRQSFTLIELLVVLALVAILSVVVVMTLNPAELLKQARDSNRLSDLATINTALNLFSTDVIGGFMGTSTVVYVSLPSTTSTCSNLGLPSLPAGYTYNCVTSANLRNTDGTGWIPVNFNRISSNSPISQLPIDPTNTTSTRLYYTYTPGGSWELNATVEASKNKLGGSNDLVSKDGGTSPSQYEIGNNLNLSPIETGDSSLVGYWNFEEGPNATSTDRSGYGNDGRWNGSGAHYSAGKVGSYAGDFSTTTLDYIQLPVSASITSALNNSFTFVFWAKLSSPGGAAGVLIGPRLTNARIIGTPWNTTKMMIAEENITAGIVGYTYPSQSWFQIGISCGDGRCNAYGNGNLAQTATQTFAGSYNGAYTINAGTPYGQTAQMDDVRIYGRVLSAAEILALYNSTR